MSPQGVPHFTAAKYQNRTASIPEIWTKQPRKSHARSLLLPNLIVPSRTCMVSMLPLILVWSFTGEPRRSDTIERLLPVLDHSASIDLGLTDSVGFQETSCDLVDEL